MSLPSISVKRPVTIVMITLIIMILGGVSLSRMPIDLLPEMEIPYAVVSTNYSGVGPQEIEKLITKPLEESVGTVGNIKSISSVSSEGNSIVIAEFNYGTDMDFASLEMREKIDLVKGFLPEDASSPMVMKIDPNSQPIIQLTISNGGDIAKLQTIAEDSIKPRLERLDGVASITVSGGYEQQVQINVNQEKMRGYGLTIDYLSKILAAENLNMPGGEVKKGKQQL
ncbi:MAG: efflux RND transporter permease subunit, partial [Clostridiaceae bacterium]